jgi:hypothetical protein
MKEKILILGSSSFSGASLVNFLLNKKKYLVFGTYRRKKIKQFLPYSYNQNIKFFNEIQVDFLGNPQKIIKIISTLKPDYIIDFASICMVNESWKNPEIYFKTNVLQKAERTRGKRHHPLTYLPNYHTDLAATISAATILDSTLSPAQQTRAEIAQRATYREAKWRSGVKHIAHHARNDHRDHERQRTHFVFLHLNVLTHGFGSTTCQRIFSHRRYSARGYGNQKTKHSNILFIASSGLRNLAPAWQGQTGHGQSLSWGSNPLVSTRLAVYDAPHDQTTPRSHYHSPTR